MYTHSKETQSSLTPDTALQILKEGNNRFVNNLKANRNLLQIADNYCTSTLAAALAIIENVHRRYYHLRWRLRL